MVDLKTKERSLVFVLVEFRQDLASEVDQCNAEDKMAQEDAQVPAEFVMLDTRERDLKAALPPDGMVNGGELQIAGNDDDNPLAVRAFGETCVDPHTDAVERSMSGLRSRRSEVRRDYWLEHVCQLCRIGNDEWTRACD